MDRAAPGRRERSVWRRKPAIAGFGLLALALLLKGCFVPPVVLEAGSRTLDLADFPPGAERVDLAAAPGIMLRGVQIAGPPGAPVMLHLLESMASITDGSRPLWAISIHDDPACEAGRVMSLSQPEADGWPAESAAGGSMRLQHRWLSRLAPLGLSGLVVDYEGVGASDGERSPDTLRRDARAAWTRAVDLAGGDEHRVILRGTSLGTLAAATLLQDGAQPGAVILIDPVRAETVALNFAAMTWNPALLFVARWFVRDAVDVDLIDVLDRVRVPLLVVQPRHDMLLLPDESEALRAAVERSGGTALLRRESHEGLSISSRDVLAVELAFLQRVFPAARPDRTDAALDRARLDGLGPAVFAPGSPERERLDALLSHTALPTPELTVAAALAHVPDDSLADLSDWLAWLPPERLAGLDVHALSALLDTADPTGRLAMDPSTAWSAEPHATQEVLRLFADTVRPGQFQPMGFGGTLTGSMHIDNPHGAAINAFIEGRRQSLEKLGLPAAEADRRTVRIMLKAACIPDRVVTAADGSHGVEVFEHGAWHALEIP